MSRKLLLIGFLILGLVGFVGIFSAGAQTTANITMNLDGNGNYFRDLASVGDPNMPAKTYIRAGDKVTWTNVTGVHTVTTEAALSGGPPAPCGTGDNFDSGLISVPGATFSHTFMTPGFCNYYCTVHQSLMQGEVEVAINPEATTTTTTSTTTTSTTTTTTTIPNQPPSAVSLTPVNISTEPSVVQSFTAGYSDPDGWQNITDASLFFSGSTHNEWMHYNPQTNKFTLLGASGDCSPGNGATLSNGFLNFNCGSSNASGSGTMLTVTYNLTPQPPLSGAPYILIIAVVDQAGATGNKTPGSWIVNRRPSADSVTPMNSSNPPGIYQVFTSVYSDPDGWQNIAAANFYLSGNGGTHNEWLHYLAAPNLFTMMGTSAVCNPGQATTIQNGFLTLNCGASSVSGSGTVLTVIFRVTPQPPSLGMQYNIFSAASDHAGAAFGIFAGTWQIQ